MPRVATRPVLTVEEILAWAEAHRARAGRRPGRTSGPIPEAPGETWAGIEAALREGLRGLPGGQTLASLLARRQEGPPGRPGKPPWAWTAQEDEWVRTLPAREAACKVGCSVTAVYSRRRRLGIRRGRRRG